MTTLTAAALPEAQPYPQLYAALDANDRGDRESAPAARGWALALARYELLVLAELGYGLERETLPPALDQRVRARMARNPGCPGDYG